MFTPAICFAKLILSISLAMLSSYDNTLFASSQNNEKLIKSLQSTLNGVLECTKKTASKAMQINVIYFGVCILIQKLAIASSNSEELSGVIVRSRSQNILKTSIGIWCRININFRYQHLDVSASKFETINATQQFQG